MHIEHSKPNELVHKLIKCARTQNKRSAIDVAKVNCCCCKRVERFGESRKGMRPREIFIELFERQFHMAVSVVT